MDDVTGELHPSQLQLADGTFVIINEFMKPHSNVGTTPQGSTNQNVLRSVLGEQQLPIKFKYYELMASML